MYKVGDIVKLTMPCMKNPVGTIGICYDSYVLGDHIGASFIFENGNYDGFSPEEQNKMLKYIGHDNKMRSYVFTNVMRLSRDFESDFFKDTFNKWNKEN